MFGFALAIATPADAHANRSQAAKAEFQRQHPCPSTGRRRGRCHGFVMDHRVALCVGGPDVAANLRWQSVAEAKAKDRWECKPGWEEHLKQCEAQGCFVVRPPA